MVEPELTLSLTEKQRNTLTPTQLYTATINRVNRKNHMASKISKNPQPYAYWRELREKDPRSYYSSSVQKLVLASRQSMSHDDFWETDDDDD